MEIQTTRNRGLLMRNGSYILYNTVYKPFLKLYLKRTNQVTLNGFKLRVSKQVFHPKLFFSTRYLLDFMTTLPLYGTSFLEIGSGSGVISLLAHKKGAIVTAIDVDKRAVEDTAVNFSKNFREYPKVSIYQSDLFDNLQKQVFDIVMINPPYYFKKPVFPGQKAWYCGENGEYFERLFSGLGDYVHAQSQVFMILEERCEIERIKEIAGKNKFIFQLQDERKIKWEKNFIFRIVKST